MSDVSPVAESTPPWVDVTGLRDRLRELAAVRDWERFHSPKNLAMALGGEVGELVACFQWMTEGESRKAMLSPAAAHAITEEMADVLMYFVRLADVLGVDLDAAVRAKVRMNEGRFPFAGSGG